MLARSAFAPVIALRDVPSLLQQGVNNDDRNDNGDRQKRNDTIGQNGTNTHAARAARVMRHFFDVFFKNKTFLILEVLTATGKQTGGGGWLSVTLDALIISSFLYQHFLKSLFLYICN